jgi:FAD dependent oxidoreductase
VLRPPFKEAEVLVVGASLAGLCAAYSAARVGAATLLVDAAPEIGARPNPATLLMEPIWRCIGLSVPQARSNENSRGCRWAAPPGAARSLASASSTWIAGPSPGWPSEPGPRFGTAFAWKRRSLRAGFEPETVRCGPR